MKIHTPLGDDFLLINKFTAREAISELFTYEVELLHEENDVGYEPTDVDPAQIVGKGVAISIQQRDDTARTFSGMVSSFSRGNRHTRFSFYYATIVPHVWLLTQNIQSRIFQHKSVPEILQEVFSGFEVRYEIQGNFQPRNYCVQYRESDFDFASRIMEEEGIFYYFEHTEGKHTMVIANTPQSHVETPSKNVIAYNIKTERTEDFISSISDLWIDTRLQTGKVTLWDHNFQLPTSKLDAQQPSTFTLGDNQQLEFYDFPAGYARKYDGIDRGGGEQPSALQAVYEDNRRTAENLMRSIDADYQVLSGTSDCSALTAGHKFTLEKHPNGSLNTGYIVTNVTHEAEQNPSYLAEAEVDEPYSNSFSCIRYGSGAPTYCPPRKTPKPYVRGSQTAIVVGPAGEEIFTDKYGRIKVQFFWDRHGQYDSDSSCWVRVAQLWASNGWGSMFIPRIGMEVVVQFLEGDPDQPIVTGCVYNPETMPAYTLPDEKTKSGIKSNSSKGGNGFNELRFEDKAGEEQIFVHAQKNMDVRVLNDYKKIVGNDKHVVVENNRSERVARDSSMSVGGDRKEKVTGSVSKEAGMDIQEKAGMNYALDAGMEVHIKAGMTAVIEAGTSLTLKVGGNFININPGGVFISGTMVMINSGGAAGSGSGCNPDPPSDPLEADTAESGQVARAPGTSPPPAPAEYSALATAFSNASASGTPFVAV